MSTTVQSPSTSGVIKDTFLWRRKKLSLSVLATATATWVLLEVYQFNFLTVASWLGISIVASMFLWGNLLRILRKKEPDMSGLEVSEQWATEAANTFRGWMEEGVRWVFRVGAERQWYVSVAVVSGLWVLSLLGSLADFLTLLYIGIVAGMTAPVIYVRYEYKIKECGEKAMVQGRKLYDMVDDKVFRKMKHNVFQSKEKKVE
ncbi:PREDICTED: reticulon-like protein B13 isoform X2 [Nelumbo nucifera]|uniref:Reticulon-like protein n=2 Tax=Nelumbo nucifera TaxID=4432 RepID=A0A822ZTH7_NELNU|nr:PREDICTED: reticulon-like protein B13 isoform X2 [Nelumbo nucifera]DAD46841.1 TPA_asm: hypothetical protein HUJ06_016778 [Nelumbo nucifera]